MNIAFHFRTLTCMQFKVSLLFSHMQLVNGYNEVLHMETLYRQLHTLFCNMLSQFILG